MKKKPLTNIPTGKISRGFKLAKLGASIGADRIASKLANAFADRSEKGARELAFQIEQARKLAEVLSQMKGAAMKLGQILSIHGEELFPKEVVEVLSMLQHHSDSMAFREIEKVLKAELGERYGTKLVEVSSDPIAAASIGQVHRGIYAPEKLDVAIKVQYPGVDVSIDSDIDALASLLGVLAHFPNAAGYTEITDEVKLVLRQETDYETEGKTVEFFRKFYADDEKLVVPRLVPELSTRRVLTTEYMPGISVQEFAQSTASDQARSFLGRKFLEMFYREMFEAGVLQTDPNFANYIVQWKFGVQQPGLVLLDFGATKCITPEFREQYRSLIRACMSENYEGIRQAGVDIGILRPDDPKEISDMHFELAQMFTEPFRANQVYDWGESDLASRLRKLTPRFVFSFKLRPPPRDFVFLSRKIAGVYFFLAAIRAKFNPRELLDRFL